MRFEDKVVIVTGSSSGIGATAAKLYAKEGAHVVIVGRNQERLNNVAEDIQKLGHIPLVIKADVSQEEDVKNIVSKTIDAYGRLDILINNAGISRYCDIMGDNFLTLFDEVMNINLRGAVQLTRLAAPYLIKSKGNIVNISSVLSTLLACTNTVSYSVSKAALDAFSRSSALELGQFGVRINIVSPGPVATDFLEHNECSVTDMNLVKPSTILNRVSTPKEIADMILYLSSEQAIGITGANFTVDNGILINRSELKMFAVEDKIV